MTSSHTDGAHILVNRDIQEKKRKKEGKKEGGRKAGRRRERGRKGQTVVNAVRKIKWGDVMGNGQAGRPL